MIIHLQQKWVEVTDLSLLLLSCRPKSFGDLICHPILNTFFTYNFINKTFIIPK